MLKKFYSFNSLRIIRKNLLTNRTSQGLDRDIWTVSKLAGTGAAYLEDMEESTSPDTVYVAASKDLIGQGKVF